MYKRQGVELGIGDLEVDDRVDLHGDVILGDDGLGIEAVSYTHLDVYKRQHCLGRNTMKTKLTALLLAAALTLTLAACGEKTNADTPLPDEPPEMCIRDSHRRCRHKYLYRSQP